MNTLEAAYTLLPPPLSSLPAKYWTSISLWLHSYTVARTFQGFVRTYAESRDVEAPLDDEAFLIGFLHDLGQKLRLRGRPSEESLLEWARSGLESLGLTRGEAEELSRYLYTNPAESLSDPLYDRSVWRLLWLADRLQGIDNPLAIVQLLTEAREDLGEELDIVLLNAMLPQPFMRTLISKIVSEKVEEIAEERGVLAVPVTTPYGLAVITDNPNAMRTIEIGWEEIRGGFKGAGILPEKLEEDLEWNMNCCEDSSCKARCSRRGEPKPQECKDHRFKKRDCEKGLYPGRRGNSYRIALIYYGFRRRAEGKIILPKDVEGMLQGIRIRGAEFRDGTRRCPICGVATPVGVVGDFLKFFIKRITIEQWARSLYPASVNRIMQEVKDYAIDPLCLGEAILRGDAAYPVLVSLTLRALAPLTVLEDAGKLAYSLLYVLGNGMPRSSIVAGLAYGHDEFYSTLRRISEIASGASTPNFYYDAFSSTVVVPYRNFMQRHQDEWLRDIVTAGVLAAWGIYPLTVSEAVPSAPSETLLSYYKGRRPLYDYQPKDRRVGHYTPYAAMAMMSLAELNLRASSENLPAFLEILDYPPEYSPLLLQYGSPTLYSRVEALRARLGVVA